MTGMALSCPGLARGSEATALSVWQPKLALSSVMFSGLSLEELCVQAEALGFEGLDLWAPFGSCRHLADARKLGADKFGTLLERHGLRIGAWTTYRPKGHEEGFPGFADFIGACGGGVVVRGSKYGKAPADALETIFERFFEELGPEIELARKHDVRLAIENHGNAILDRPESFEVFTRLNPDPKVVGIAVAPYHLQRHGEVVPEVIHTCGRQLRFFYAWQSGQGTRQLPGQGPVDFQPWLQALADEGYDHWMTPFMHGELPPAEMAAALTRAMQVLNTTPIQP